MSKNPKFFGKSLRLSWTEIILGVMTVLLGLLLLFLPDIAAAAVVCAIGAAAIVVGILHIVRYFRLDDREAVFSTDLAAGMIWLVGGVLVIVLRRFLISLLPVFFGLVLLVGGIAKVQGALSFKRMRLTRWYLELIGAVVSIALGTLILCKPFSTAMVFMRVIGASLLVEGVQDLISIYIFKKRRDAFFVETQARDS